MKSWIASLVVVGALLVPAAAYAGEFRYLANGDVKYDGEITAGDDIKLTKIIEKKRFYSIYLRSGGGDPIVAMQMGRILRKNHQFARVDTNSYCYSACVFILAGAVIRSVSDYGDQPLIKVSAGKVAIHRPTFTNLPADWNFQQVDSAYKTLRQKVGEYFTAMNIPSELEDAMYVVPPEEIRVLSKAERKRYLLEGTDPAYDEKITASEARAYRLSPSEYRRRNAIADKACVLSDEQWIRLTDPPDAASKEIEACTVGIIAGISIETARVRAPLWASILATRAYTIDIDECQPAILIDGARDCPR